MKKQLLQATLLHFQAIKAKAETNLEIYLTNSTGIGEHSDIVQEIVTLTQTITEADEAIQYLTKRLSTL